MTPRISNTLRTDWIRREPIRAGQVPATLGTPTRYVCVVDDQDRLAFRVDVYAPEPDCFAFEGALIWRDNLVIGLGSYTYAVSLVDKSSVTIALDDYFAALHSTDDYVLVATGARLLCLGADCAILWWSPVLAVDGVVVHDPGPPVIHGEAEWDPPGGWEPFSISAADGSVLAGRTCLE